MIDPPANIQRRQQSINRVIRESDLIVALGGDGTLLRAARLVGEAEKPIMGINLGSLGFLTEFSVTEAKKSLLDFINGNYCQEQRMVLQLTLREKQGFAFNDCAINMGSAGRMIGISVYYGGNFVNKFVGDGIVVATPTGSTAYSLAAGGPVVYPTMSAFILTPLCPHTLAARPIILPAEHCIQLQLAGKSQKAIVSLDGQIRWLMDPEQQVTIRRPPFSVRLVIPREKSYFEILREKLKWAGSQQ